MHRSITPRHRRTGHGWKAAVLRGGVLPLVALALSLCFGMLVPIYTDEIGWRFQERAGIDLVDILYTDLCGPNTLARPPWFMMPVRMFSALANGALADPFYIRLEGVLCALAWLGLVWLLSASLAVTAERRGRLRMLVFSLMGIGTLPFILVLSRPEQPIILAVTAMLVVCFARPRLAAGQAAWLKAAAIVLLAVVAFSYHLKGILYAPVAIVALLLCARGRGTALPRAMGVAVLSVFALSAARYWLHRMSCPGNAALEAIHGRENIMALLASSDSIPAALARAIPGANPLSYVLLAVPHDSPMSGWIPIGVVPTRLTVFYASVMLLLWLALLLIGTARLIRFAVAKRWHALLRPELSLAVVLMGVTLAWGLSQLNKNVYEAGHVLPMLAVFVLLSFALPTPKREDRALTLAANTALPLALVSQIVIAALFAPPLLAAWRSPGYIDAQPFSISARNYPAIRRDIERVTQAAQIAPDGRSRRLLVDELTYLALQDTRLPLHRFGVLGMGVLPDPIAYLRSRGSDGVVIGCRYLPANMRAVAVRSGEICAISRRGLARAEP